MNATKEHLDAMRAKAAEAKRKKAEERIANPCIAVADQLVNATKAFTKAKEKADKLISDAKASLDTARKDMKQIMDDAELKVVQHNGWLIHTLNYPKLSCEPIMSVADIPLEDVTEDTKDDGDGNGDDGSEFQNGIAGPTKEEMDLKIKFASLHDAIDMIMRRSKGAMSAAEVTKALRDVDHPKGELSTLYSAVYTYIRSQGRKYKQLEDKRFVHVDNHVA